MASSSGKREELQVSAKPVGLNISQQLPSTSRLANRQGFQVQAKPGKGKVLGVESKPGKGKALRVESKQEGKIQEALPSQSSQDQNARTLQVLPTSARSEMTQVDAYSTVNVLQLDPGFNGQVGEDKANPGGKESEVKTVSMSTILQVLPSPNGSVLQDHRRPTGLLVREFQHPSGKLVKIGSKSYFVVGDHTERGWE